MSFYPTAGEFSINDFSDSIGVTFGNQNLQSITGGYVSLLPQNTYEYTYISSWTPFTGWSLSNGMQTRAVVSSSFLITGRFENIAAAYSGVSGYQRSVVSAGAWEIFTPEPDYVDVENTINSQVQCVVLNNSSTYSGWYNYFNAGGSTASIEFDVASFYDPYSGTNILAGYLTGQNNMTGLARLSDKVCHGVYISNGTYADFLEILPFGIRSASHPELAIPIDLTEPRRIRVGLNNQDIYIQCDNGSSAVGYSKFDTPTVGNPSVILGAPLTTGLTDLQGEFNIFSSVGNTYWGSVKVVTGQLVTQVLSGTQQYYSTSPVTLYTDSFDPQIPISAYVSALVGFVPYQGGTTTVTVQYSGVNGFTDAVSNTITSTSSNPFTLDLSSVPVYTYPRGDLGSRSSSNPIRFKITQSSSNGQSPPPSIDYIELTASKTTPYLDIFPNWKRTNAPVNVTMSVKTGDYILGDPETDRWTSLLINVPGDVGLITGSAIVDQSTHRYPVYVQGTGQIEMGGRYGYHYSNYIYTSGSAQTGSQAETYFGNSPVENFFPNPLFENYRSVISEPQYITGRVFGEIAADVYIPSLYTGRSSVTYSAESVIRPESLARVNRINRILGRSTATPLEYVQSVNCPATASSGVHDGTVGLEARIPSGIATSNMLIDVDLQISQGSSLALYLSGALTPRSWTIPGEDFRTYRQVSFPIQATSNGEIRIGFAVPSGSSLASGTTFNLDNLTVTPIETSYLYATGISCETHKSGVIHDISAIGTYPATRADTVFNASLYLNSYPIGTGIIYQITGSQGYGLTVRVNNQGYITSTFDLVTDSWASSVGSQGFYQYLGSQTVTSENQFPLGRWVNLGFIHQSSTYDKLSTVSYSGATVPTMFAASNRAYITFDGYPVQSHDCEAGWYKRNVTSPVFQDCAPVLSYIPISGNARATILSGITASVDALSFSRPPCSDAEMELSIKGARVAGPYFVPDQFSNGTVSSTIANEHVFPSWVDIYGYDVYLGSCYNFSNPGYTHWDHGPWRNHLIFNGVVSKEITSPYSGLGSTRFYSGAYATAKYSSATERSINSQSNLNLISFYSIADQSLGRITAKGWVYPRTAGSLFTMLYDQNNKTGNRMDLQITDSGYLRLARYNSSGVLAATFSGTEAKSFSGWHYVGFDYNPGTGLYTPGTSGNIVVTLFNGTGYELIGITGGVDYNFRYGGHTGDTTTGAFLFGGNIDCNFADWVIHSPSNSAYPGPNNVNSTPYYTGSKGGRYQTVLKGHDVFSGSVTWDNFHSGTIGFPITSSESENMYWVAAMNAYDNNARLNGGALLYDDRLFKEVLGYHLKYDTSTVDSLFGGTDSPIRIGNTVPNNAINIARLNSVEFNTEESITTIDLAGKNVNNLSDYKGGLYSLSRNNGAVTSTTTTGMFKGINSYAYSGRVDVVFSGSLFSDNVEISTTTITSPDLTVPSEAYYYYLLGRGNYGVYVPETQPHYFSGITELTTGTILNSYISNLDKIRSSIITKNSNGDIIDFNEYPFEVIALPYKPSDLEASIRDESDIHLDGFGSSLSGTYTGSMLPNNVYSVILMLNKKSLPNTSVWAHYNSYDYKLGTIGYSSKEIINALPLLRMSQYFETPTAGQYSIVLNESNSNYNLIMYGIESGLSGTI